MLGWKLCENGVPNRHTHFQVLWKIFLKHLSGYISCYVLSTTNWQISNPETEHKKPSPNMSSLSTLWYPWPSQTAPRKGTVRSQAHQEKPFPWALWLSHFSDTITALAKELASCNMLRGFSQQRGLQASLRGPIPERPAAKRCSSQPPPASPTSTGTVAGILHLFCSFSPVEFSLTLPSRVYREGWLSPFRISPFVFKRRFWCKSGGEVIEPAKTTFAVFSGSMNLWCCCLFNRGHILLKQD